MRAHVRQQRDTINSYVGITGNMLIGSCLVPHRFDGNTYHKLLDRVLRDLMVAFPEDTRVFFHHNEVLVHFSRNVL